VFEELYDNRAKDWESESVKEWNTNIRKAGDVRPTYFTGVMQCFCLNEKHNKVPKNKEYFTLKSKVGVPVCGNFNKDKLVSKGLGTSVSFVIIAINLVLKKVIIKGVQWVGQDTNSAQLTSITNGVFIAQFFNTGILLLLINGNMSEHWPKAFTRNI
jgi:hypothetical protein